MNKTFKHTYATLIAFMFSILSLFIVTPITASTIVYNICSVNLTETDDGVILTWNAIDGAETYDIYRITNDAQSAVKIATTQDNSYTDTSTSDENITYTYYVVPLDETGTKVCDYEESTITINNSDSVEGIIAFFFIIVPACIMMGLAMSEYYHSSCCNYY